MSVAVKQIPQILSEILIGIRERLPLLSAEEQTRLSWATMVEFYDDIPEIYQNAFDNLTGEAGTFLYAVLTPSYAGFLSSGKEKLVCCFDRKVCVVEESEGIVITTMYAMEDIYQVEVGKALLRSWVRISGIVAGNSLTTSEFKCNTITLPMFTAMLERIRVAADLSEGKPADTDYARFDFLSRLNYKLMNYGRQSLIPGEKIIHVFWQSEIRAERIGFFRYTLSRPHLTILTKRELILVQDGHNKGWGMDVEYGGTWTYLPLNKITSISLVETDNNILIMSIHLPNEYCIDTLFSADNRSEVETLVGRIEAMLTIFAG